MKIRKRTTKDFICAQDLHRSIFIDDESLIVEVSVIMLVVGQLAFAWQ